MHNGILAGFVILVVLYVFRLFTGPFVYHMLKAAFWVAVAYGADNWLWSLIAAWDILWLVIWLERDPYRLKN